MYASEKGFLKMKKSLCSCEKGKSSVKQVLTPPFVAMADHAHELP
jgi:hypothetical protein